MSLICSLYVNENFGNVVIWAMKRGEDNLIDQSHSRCKHTYKQRPLTIYQRTEFVQLPKKLWIKSGTFNIAYIELMTEVV